MLAKCCIRGLFHFEKRVYLLVIDYVLLEVELALIDQRTTTDAVILTIEIYVC